MFKNFNVNDQKIFITAALVFAVTMFLTLTDEWVDLISEDSTKGLVKIAKISKSKKDVRQRHNVSFSWKNAKDDVAVFQGDSIFTGPNSTALVQFENGDALKIEPNSLVVITRNTNGVNIDLEFGSVEGVIKTKNTFIVSTEGQQAKLEGENSRVKIDAGDGGSLVLSSLEGQVFLDGDKVDKKLELLEVVELNEEAEAQEITNYSLELLTPLNEDRLRYKKDQTVKFQWQTERVSDRAVIKIAQDKDFKNIVTKSQTSNTSYIGYNLPADTKLYWTVVDEGVNSPIGEFWLLDNKAPILIQPRQGDHFYFDQDINQTRATKIDLVWAKGSPSRRYEVQVAKSPQFSGEIQNFISDSKRFRTPQLAEGKYFWRVRGMEFNDSSWSSAQQFSIGPDPSKNLAPPAASATGQILLLTKSHKQNQNNFLQKTKQQASSLIEQTQIFAWQPVKFAKKYRIIVSKSKNFKNALVDTLTDTNSYQWKYVKPGKYYWKTQSLGKEGSKSELSSINELVVLAAPPRSRTTVLIEETINDKAMMDYALPPVNIEWEPIVFAKSYEVEFSATADFKNSTTYRTSNNSRKVRPPKSGTYYWRVRGFNSDQVAISNFSKAYPIEFRRTFEDERFNENLLALHPKPDQELVFVGQATPEIIFEWTEAGKNINYELQLATDSGFKDIINSKKTDYALYSFKDNLQDRKIYWRVRASNQQGKNSPWTKPSRFFVKFEKEAFDSEVSEAMYLARQRAKVRKQIFIAEYKKRTANMRSIASNLKLQLDQPSLLASQSIYILSGNFNGKTPLRKLASLSEADSFSFIKNPPSVEWEPVIAARRYIVEIASDQKFENILHKRPTYNSFFSWDEARPGKYYLRVQAFNDKYEPSDYSGTKTLHIETQRPISLSAKYFTNTIDTNNQDWAKPSAFTLTWSPRLFAKSYEFQISRTKNFKASESIKTKMAEKKIQVAKAGSYFWRVRALNKWNVAISTWSEIFDLDITQKPQDNTDYLRVK